MTVYGRRSFSTSSTVSPVFTNRMCFTSYYILLVISCALAIAFRLHLLPAAAAAFVSNLISSCPPPGNHPRCLALVFILLLAHGCRRLTECVCIHAWTKRPANALIFLGGCGFYAMQIISYIFESSCADQDFLAALEQDASSAQGLTACAFFVFASLIQLRAHAHLAATPKNSFEGRRNGGGYSLPRAAMFRVVMCPHYSAEILLYISFAVASYVSRTSVFALVWTAANLAVTAFRTRKMQIADGGAGAKLQVRWLIVPWVF